jgi:hypothetical protein
MAILNKKESATIVKKIFEILVEYPSGLSEKELWQRLEAGYGDEESNGGKTGPILPSFENLTFRCVPPIKAGWLRVIRDKWMLSPEGVTAFKSFNDPEEFMREAGNLSARGWLAAHFPRSYARAAKSKDQISSEVRTIKRVGVSRLAKEWFGKPSPWQEVLPVQRPHRIKLAEKVVPGDSLLNHLAEMSVSTKEGGHAVYVSDQGMRSSIFAELKSFYPDDAGLKIIKNPGAINDNQYVLSRNKGDSKIQLGMVHGHRHLSMVANVLYLHDLGPRLYDLVEIQVGDEVWTAYVVQQVEGREPTTKECEAGINKLRELHSKGLLKVILPDGFEDEEFACPGCANNALVDGAGKFRYIDFQNFLLGDYERFLTELALEAADKSHFGDKSLLRGGRYLYQTVPGVKLPAKRNVASRIPMLTRLMNEAGASITGRVVLDVGCNIGMMMAEYLKLGAMWCHGWDRSYVTPHTERMLLALGCTRFSTTGNDIANSRPLINDLPSHVPPLLEGCVVSYLAVRGHLSWLQALKDIPWAFLIYEGHEGETLAEFEGYLDDFKKLTSFRVGARGSYVDGDSEERTVAILARA